MKMINYDPDNKKVIIDVNEEKDVDNYSIEDLLYTLALIYKRFGNTTVNFKNLSWGSTALWKNSYEVERYVELIEKIKDYKAGKISYQKLMQGL